MASGWLSEWAPDVRFNFQGPAHGIVNGTDGTGCSSARPKIVCALCKKREECCDESEDAPRHSLKKSQPRHQPRSRLDCDPNELNFWGLDLWLLVWSATDSNLERHPVRGI